MLLIQHFSIDYSIVDPEPYIIPIPLFTRVYLKLNEYMPYFKCVLGFNCLGGIDIPKIVIKPSMAILVAI